MLAVHWLHLDKDGMDLPFAMVWLYLGLVQGYMVRTKDVPFQVICIQSGEALKDRIGLWDRSDPALNAMLKLSNFTSLTSGLVTVFCVMGSFIFTKSNSRNLFGCRVHTYV
jgi:hypothetical protein